ncbi:MAG: ornithine carbamoyltransferase, partial [Desulfurivibrionaceae bacterium]
MVNHLLSLGDFDGEQLQGYLDLALRLKKESKGGIRHQDLAGKVVGLVFEKPSTRTRVS